MRSHRAGLASLTVVLALTGCSRTKPPASPPTQTASPPTQTASASPKADPALMPAVRKLLTGAKPVTSYRLSMVSNGAPLTVVARLRDGQTTKLKVMTTEGGWTLHDADAKAVYTVTTKPARVVRRGMGDKVKMPGTGVESLRKMAYAAQSMSDETLDGRPCVKITATHLGGTSMALWFDKEYGLPRQLESNKINVTMNYEQINAVPDSEFALPKGVPVTDGGTMPSAGHGGMGGAGGGASPHGSAQPPAKPSPGSK